MFKKLLEFLQSININKKSKELDINLKLNKLSFLTESRFNELLHLTYKNGPDENIDNFSSIVYFNLNKYKINTELRLIHFLSQIGHESGEFRYTEELASGENYEWRKDLGNTKPGDGVKYKGRGLIQLTGKYNYIAFSKYMNTDNIVHYPDCVKDDYELCVMTAFFYWEKTKLNNYADKDDIKQVTKRINGGYNGLQDRKRLYDLAKLNLNFIKIKFIQELLNIKYGSELVVDGIYGQYTEKELVKNNASLNNWQVLI